VILENRQSRCSLQLFIVESEEIGFGLLDFIEHVFPELFCGLNLFPFFLIDVIDPILLLLLKRILEFEEFCLEQFLLFLVLFDFIILDLDVIDEVVYHHDLIFVGVLHLIDLIVLVANGLLDRVLQLFDNVFVLLILEQCLLDLMVVLIDPLFIMCISPQLLILDLLVVILQLDEFILHLSQSLLKSNDCDFQLYIQSLGPILCVQIRAIEIRLTNQL